MYQSILVPVDDSVTSRRGFAEAVKLAKALGSKLHLLNVVDVRWLFGEVSAQAAPQQLLEDWRLSGELLAARCVDEARAAGVVADSVVRCDPGLRVSETILDEATESGAGLVVMGTHGRRGLTRMALGSDAEWVLRESTVPVLLVREPSQAVVAS